MQHLTIYEATSALRSWILSCATYEQLRTCENLIERYILSRPRDDAFHTCVKILTQCMQIRRVDLQLQKQIA